MHKVVNIFPTPVYVTNMETELTPSEMEEINDLSEKEKEREKKSFEKMELVKRTKDDTYIFDTKLDGIKKFCEEHIDTYINEIISPKNSELDFYITQSWLNVLSPGGIHPIHYHSNSIISGVFYVSTVKGDAIQFYDINTAVKDRTKIEPGKTNLWNACQQNLGIENNVLLLFPSWIGHGVNQNISKITDRISISFNVFVKGTIGEYYTLDNLNLQ